MLKLLIATSCVVVVCQGFLQIPGLTGMGGNTGLTGMGGNTGLTGRGGNTGMGMPNMNMGPRNTPGVFNFGRFVMDFNRYLSPAANLQQVCNDALLKNRGMAGDYLSDVMGKGISFMMANNPMTSLNPLAMVNGANSAQWGCLLNAATNGLRNMNNIANGVSDYFDAVVEHPVRRTIETVLGVPFNPCEMVFCGEGGMTPLAMMNAVMSKLNMRQNMGPLGATIFGSRASAFNKKVMSTNPMGFMGFSNPMARNTNTNTMRNNAMGNNGAMPTAPNTATNTATNTANNMNSMRNNALGNNAMPPTPTTATTINNNAMAQPNNMASQTGGAAPSNTAAAGAGAGAGGMGGKQGGGLNPVAQMMANMRQGAGGNPAMMNVMNAWRSLTGTGNNAGASPGKGSGNMWQQAMNLMRGGNTGGNTGGNPMMDMWKKMAASLTGTGTGTGTGNMFQQMMGGGNPSAPTMTTTAAAAPANANANANANFNANANANPNVNPNPVAPGLPGMGTLNNIMNMMFAHRALQDAPETPMRLPGMMGPGPMGPGAGTPAFNIFGGSGLPAAQQQQQQGGMGGMMADIFRMMG